MNKLLLFPASLRQQSHQRRLIDYLAAVIGDRCALDIVESGQVDLPIFNQDKEHDPGIMADVAALHRRFQCADGIVVASPEYNGHVPAYLKNTLDWISRLPRIDERYAGSNCFQGKPVLLCSASTGWTGGILGLKDARSVFAYLGCTVVADQVCVSDAEHWVSGRGFRFEEGFATHISRVVERYLSTVGSLSPRQAPAHEKDAHHA